MKYSSQIYQKFRVDHNFFRFLLIDRILNRQDNIVLVTGKRASGKTTMALKQILGFSNMEANEEYYNKEKNIKCEDNERIKYDISKSFTEFDMEKHMCFSKKELQELWKNERNAFILADEAIVNANKRNSMSKANKILTEIVTINRKNFNTVFFCLPSIEDFDMSILQYITHWIHIDSRGLAAFLLPNPPSLFGRKSWDVDKMKKIYEKFLESNPSISSVPYWLFDNFRGYMQFKPLGTKIEQRYEEIAHRKKNADTDAENEEIKVRKNGLTQESQTKISEVAKQLLKGELESKEDYYQKATGLGITKERFNKEIGKQLINLGEGRTPIKVISDNKKVIEESSESWGL